MMDEVSYYDNFPSNNQTKFQTAVKRIPYGQGTNTSLDPETIKEFNLKESE